MAGNDARWLLLANKSEDTERLARWTMDVQAALELVMPDWKHEVTNTSDLWEQRATQVGGFAGGSWTEFCASSTRWDGQPRFHGFIWPLLAGEIIGRATYDILEAAARESKHRLVYCDGAADMFVDLAIERHNDDWKEYGRIRPADPPPAASAPPPAKPKPVKPMPSIKPKKPAPRKPLPMDSSGDFIEDCKNLIDAASDLASDIDAASDFADSVIEKAEGMMAWAEEHDGYATERMQEAVGNMMTGIDRWYSHRRRL